MIAPQDSSLAFLNFNAVNFAAQTGNITGYDYYMKGLTGGFNAYYDTLPVHEKIREYAGSESRDIRFFPLKISDKEYKKLIDSLYSWSEKPYPYKFLTYNCTHGIYSLLQNSLDSLPLLKSGIMAPQDLIHILQKENRLEYPYLLPSLKERIVKNKDKEQAKLEFMEWENLQKGAQRDTLRSKRMAELRYSVSKKHKEKRILFKRENSFIKPHGYSRLDIGTQVIEKEANAHIHFRPLLHDPTDNSSYYSAYSTLELLSFGLNFNKNRIYLREFDLVHIRSAPLHDSFFKSWSWDLFAGYKNEYTALNSGFGKSIYINEKRKLVMELMLLNSIKCKDNFNCDDFIGFETQLNKRWTGNYRYGAEFAYLRKIPYFKKHDFQFKIWQSYDINSILNLYAESIIYKKLSNIGIFLRFYI